jgi:serine/threonine protein phosphatase PrpC
MSIASSPARLPSTALRWQVFGHSQIGSAHRRRGIVNQDHVGWHADPAAAAFVGAVADGHGGSAYFRAEVGSRLAVQAALDCLRPWEQSQAPDPGRVAAAIHRRWVDLVGAHQATDPYAQGVEPGDLVPYGSTLVAAASSPRWLVTVQIGDGDVYVGDHGGPLRHVEAGQDAFVGELTLSLCLPEAAAHFTVRVADLDWAEAAPDFVVLATDGVGKSFPTGAAFAQTLAQMRRICADPSTSPAAVADQLPAWLGEVSARGSGDDASLLVATRVPDHDVW